MSGRAGGAGDAGVSWLQVGPDPGLGAGAGGRGERLDLPQSDGAAGALRPALAGAGGVGAAAVLRQAAEGALLGAASQLHPAVLTSPQGAAAGAA